MDREEAYKIWCEHSQELLKECESYNKWRKESQKYLLTKLAPRIAKLGETFYTGCGFHYDMERRLGKQIDNLSMPIQWHAGNCEKIGEERGIIMVWQVCFKMLVEDVKKAEKSIPKCKKILAKIDSDCTKELEEDERQR